MRCLPSKSIIATLLLGLVSQLGPARSSAAEEYSVDPVPESISRAKSDSMQESLRQALGSLMRSAAGRALVERACALWGLATPLELPEVLRWGKASRTDAVLTRYYDPSTGEETRERQVLVFLKEGQAHEALTLDLAHELVHATSRPGWDPYDPSLTAGKYIQAAIEGEGGEVDAVILECQVGFELGLRNCEKYLQNPANGRILSREKILREFYRVGPSYSALSRRLREGAGLLPLLSAEVATLISSTGSAPYPVALLDEFEEMTRIACENSKRRMEATTESLAKHRASARVRAESFLARRCTRLAAN